MIRDQIYQETRRVSTIGISVLDPAWVEKVQIKEKSIQQTGAEFIFGADCFKDLGNADVGYHKVTDDNIIRGMTALSPALRIFAWLPILKEITQKILIFKKD